MGNLPRVYGIGLSRTGNKSLRKAIRWLGWKNTRAYGDNREERGRLTLFSITGDTRNLDYFLQFGAWTEFPCACYEWLAKVAPESKFILTVRDPSTWWRSFEASKAKRWKDWGAGKAAHSRVYTERVFGSIKPSEADAKAVLARHTLEVMTYFADTDRLLIMDIVGGDGWDKLAPFLDATPPDRQFPWIRNSRKGNACDANLIETMEGAQ